MKRTAWMGAVAVRSGLGSVVEGLEGRRLMSVSALASAVGTTTELNSDLAFASGVTIRAAAPSVSSANAGIVAGSTVLVGFTVKNQGARGAEGSTTEVQIKSGDTLVADATFAEAGLALGASRVDADAIVLPAGLAAGTYRAVVTLDVNHTARQGTNTTNDSAGESFVVKAATPTEVKKANLVPSGVITRGSTVSAASNISSSVSTSAVTVVAGGTLGVAWKMSNTGQAAAGASVTAVRLGTSETAVPGTDATLLSKATGAIGAGVTVGQDGQVTIPANTPAGTYYLWVVADSTEAVSQTSTTDDFAHSVKFTVTAPMATRANLVPSKVVVASATAATPASVVVKAGGSVKVSWTMSNTGKGAAGASTTSIRIGKSETEYPSTVLGTKETPALAAGASVKQDGTFTVPAGLAAGRYFVWVGADSTGVVSQTSTGDDHAHSTGFTVVGASVTNSVTRAGARAGASVGASASGELFSEERVGLF